MIRRDDVIRYLDEYLEIEEIEDYAPQGLQVEGGEEVERIVTGVSACRELFRQAAESDAGMVIVHHGIFWAGDSPVVKGVLKERLALLLENDISLLAYHLPLDRHPRIGNNAVGAEKLGMKNREEFSGIGFQGDLEGISIEELIDRIKEIYGSDPLVFSEGPETIRRAAICSGSAPKKISEAIELGLDAYITGEVSEPVMNLAREGKIHYIAAGHYATERLGIQALGELIRDRFDVGVEFIDIPNPV